MRIAIATLLTTLLVTAPCWPQEETDPFGFTEDQYSSWGIVDAPYPYEGYDADGNYIDYGCFPVGNGLVFGHLGVDEDFNTLRGLTGPGYQTREDDGAWAVWKEGNWPDLRLAGEILPNKKVDWDSQSIQQLRGAAMVRTTQTSSIGTLSTLTYALPGAPVVIREFALESALSKAPTITFQIEGAEVDIDELVLYQGNNELTLQPSKAIVKGDVLSVLLEQDAAGIWRGAIALLATKGRPRPAIELDADSVAAHRQQTYDHWQNWSAQNLQFDTGDVRLDDMMIQLPVIIETQRDYYSGSTSPMVSYHGCWVRDNNGPILMYLANGRFEVVKRMLRYHRACCQKYGSSKMLVPLDMDLSDLAGWKPDENMGSGRPPGRPNTGPSRGSAPTHNAGDAGLAPTRQTAGDLSGIGTRTEDWEGTPVEHAEVPSLIVLQHYWLWQAMHDAGLGAEADAFITEAWAFISHNLFTMSFHPDYGVYFHGDETYTQGALYSTYDRVESGQIGYPNGYIPTQDYTSFDNTILHRAAAAALALMGEAIGREENVLQAHSLTAEMDEILEGSFASRDPDTNKIWGYDPAIATFTGQTWPFPMSNIVNRPAWLPEELLGDVPPDLGGAAIYKLFWEWNYSTPFSAYKTGHSPGYTLLSVLNEPSVSNEQFLKNLLDHASPEGAWCEILNKDRLPVPIYGRVNRIRPWESGVNYEILTRYLSNEWEVAETVWLGKSILAYRVHEQFQVPDNTQLLIITKSNNWLEQVKLDARLRSISEERITTWDAGMPFSVDDLGNALLVGATPASPKYNSATGSAAVPGRESESAGRDARPTRNGESQVGTLAPPKDGPGQGPAPTQDEMKILYLYFDREVQGGLDRRTMKDHEFWYGEEMTDLLADYKAAGGTVITPETMQMRLAYDEVVELKLLVALFPNTFTHRMSQDEIENFHHEMAEWIVWYDDVAKSRVKLKLDFIQINTLLNEQMSGPQGDSVYWMGHGDVEQMLIERGVKLDHYDNVCAFWAWDRDNESLPGGEKANQAYGGAAQGPGDDMEFLGKSKRTGYFGSAVLTSHPDRISKNATHEFLHNLDAMLEMVGIAGLSHPDQMSRQMETLLAEVTGGFEHLGLSDDDLREMVEAELRDEIHYPWPAQLVYYKQAIERVRREKYGALLKHFGERKKRTLRTQLYETFILPEGVGAYHIAYTARDGLSELALDDYDFVYNDDLVWQGEVWAGYLASDTESQSVQRYLEAQIDYPGFVTFTLGEPMAINPGLLDLGNDEGVAGAQMWVELDGGRLDFFNMGGYEYTADLPTDVGGGITATFFAEKNGYVITPRPVKFKLKPPWELEARFGLSDRNLPQLTVQVNGLPGKYDVVGRAATQYNTVQQMLVEDGLLTNVAQTWTLRVMEGEEASVSIPPSIFETISRIPMELKVTHLGEDGQTSFTHHLPGQGNIPAMLEHLGSTDLPGYIPRCRPITPKVDGELNEWTSEPSIILTPENGHIFSGEVDSKADAAIVLWLGYDDDYLYVAGGVRDDITPGNGTWDSDRINLCFDSLNDTTKDTYPDGAVGHNAWAKDDFWVFLNPMLPDGPKSMRLGGERPSGGKNGFYGAVADAKMAVVREEDGAYRFEWAIPWEALPYLAPKPGTFCGFTMFYSDYDESLSEMMYVTDWGGEDGIEWRFWDCGLLYFE